MLQLYSYFFSPKKTQNVMNDRGHSKIRRTQNREDSTFTTYDQHFNLYYTSQLVIGFKAPAYGDFTFTLRPMVLD